jgi:hypothetical protein
MAAWVTIVFLFNKMRLHQTSRVTIHHLQLKYIDGAGLKIEEFVKQITPNVNMNGLALPADEKSCYMI